MSGIFLKWLANDVLNNNDVPSKHWLARFEWHWNDNRYYESILFLFKYFVYVQCTYTWNPPFFCLRTSLQYCLSFPRYRISDCLFVIPLAKDTYALEYFQFFLLIRFEYVVYVVWYTIIHAMRLFQFYTIFSWFVRISETSELEIKSKHHNIIAFFVSPSTTPLPVSTTRR